MSCSSLKIVLKLSWNWCNKNLKPKSGRQRTCIEKSWNINHKETTWGRSGMAWQRLQAATNRQHHRGGGKRRANKFLFFNWFDHPVAALNACLTQHLFIHPPPTTHHHYHTPWLGRQHPPLPQQHPLPPTLPRTRWAESWDCIPGRQQVRTGSVQVCWQPVLLNGGSHCSISLTLACGRGVSPLYGKQLYCSYP